MPPMLTPHSTSPATAWLPIFLDFLKKIKIASKEMSAPGPIEPYGAQLRFLSEVCAGLDQGQHFFVNLKARQLGISTITWALDIFWLWMHPGLQGALIFDSGENRDVARQTITDMMDSLPPGYKIPIRMHNRSQLILANGSRLQYMAAGKKKTGSGLGRSRALNFVHASECSSWGDQKGLDSLIRALAEENPNRLYIFESTALGFNLFYDMCKVAQETPTQRFFFIGWWAKEAYRIREDDEEFKRWWGAMPYMTDEETKKSLVVQRKYGHTITPEQIAWYRKQSYKMSAGSLSEELPWDETEAFVATGSPFFSLKRITESMEAINTGLAKFSGYAYSLGNVYTDTRIQKVDTADEAELKIWEEPREDAKYVIGVDGAYGRSAEADRTAISVWRCYADKIVQVAEYATPKPEAYQAAWVMAHLAGSYRDCVINVDLLGPGELIMSELRALRQQMTFGPLRSAPSSTRILETLINVRWYVSHRLDAMGKGSWLFNTKATQDEKARLYGRMRDGYSTEQVEPRSMLLLKEMTTLVQNGLKIEASGRNKDDCVFAAALAVSAWAEWIRPGMMAEQRTFVREQAKQMQTDKAKRTGDHVMQNLVKTYFEQKTQERTDARLRMLIDGF